MADPTGTSRPGLSVHQAAVILGVSPNTVRRRVIAGSLRSERIPRPRGEVIRVYLDHVPGEVPTGSLLAAEIEVERVSPADSIEERP